MQFNAHKFLIDEEEGEADEGEAAGVVFLREEEAAADGAVVGEVGAGAADEDGGEVRERVGFDDGVVVEDPDVVAVVLLHRVAQGDVVAAGVAEVFPRL